MRTSSRPQRQQLVVGFIVFTVRDCREASYTIKQQMVRGNYGCKSADLERNVGYLGQVQCNHNGPYT